MYKLAVTLCLVISAQVLAEEGGLIEGDQVVTEEMFLDEVASLSSDQRRLLLANQGKAIELVNSLYRREKLLAEVRAREIEHSAEAQKAIRRVADQVLLRMLMEQVRSEISVPDFQTLAKQYYMTHPEEYRQPEMRRARHLLIKVKDCHKDEARKEAVALLSRARGGEDFAALAQAYSQDPGSASKGGDLGWFARGKMVKPFEEAVFGLQSSGELADVVETDFGFHVIKLEGIRAESALPFDEVKPTIIGKLSRDFVRDQTELWKREKTDPAKATANTAAIAAAYEKARTQYSSSPEGQVLPLEPSVEQK